MAKTILILNGHPDPRPERFSAALAKAYAEGAASKGHETRSISVGALDFPLIRSAAEFMSPPAQPDIVAAQEAVTWAKHVVIVHPLWLGSAPALLKGFFEQVFRYGFALPLGGSGFPRGLLAGRTARIIVTMGMPAFIYRIMFGAHGVRALERSVLAVSGIKPVRHTLIGGVEGSFAKREKWLARVKALGAAGA